MTSNPVRVTTRVQKTFGVTIRYPFTLTDLQAATQAVRERYQSAYGLEEIDDELTFRVRSDGYNLELYFDGPSSRTSGEHWGHVFEIAPEELGPGDALN